MCSRHPLLTITRCFAALALAFGASAQAPVEPLEGLDPVLLSAGKEVDGDPAITFDRGGFRYSFASAETRDRFAAAPERYEIAQHGFCARMGAPTLGNPQLFHVVQGKIYLFGSGECHRRFVADPTKYLEPEPAAGLATSTTPEALAAGRVLLERVKQSLGGVALGLAGMAPTEHSAQRAVEVLRLYQRNLWSVLKSAKSPSFVAARLDGASDSIVRLALEIDRQALTPSLDPATHRPSSLAYRGRNADGELGELAETYSDYRAVAGLWLPFATAVTWNGVPQPGRSFVVRSVEVNPELGPDTFRWPVVASTP